MALKINVKDVIHMKKTIKKLVSIAMAFTLLGTGTAITKSVSPTSDNSITAHAGIPPQYCNHNARWYWYNNNTQLICSACGSPMSLKSCYR